MLLSKAGSAVWRINEIEDGRWRMLQRVLTSIIGIAIILFSFIIYEPFFNVLILLVVGVVSYELTRIYAHYRNKPISYFPILCSLVYYVMFFIYPEDWGNLGLAIILILIGARTVLTYPKVSMEEMTFSFFTSIYGGWASMHLLTLFYQDDGKCLLGLLLLGVWGSDTGAYFVGRLFGKHKLAPGLSPKKTVEGAVGGVLTSSICCLILNYYAALLPSVWGVIFFAIVASLGGMIGDLFESYLKRVSNIKDAGKILPGHGGFLDRFDSLLFVAPIASYLIVLLKLI